jgi:opacity protein-like surface antigen
MKKILIASIAAMFIFVSAQGQLFQYGLKAGVNFSQLSMDDVTGISDPQGAYNLVTGGSVNGYQAGIMTRFNILMAFIQPEVYFNTCGGVIQKVQSGETTLLDVSFNRIDIPVLVGVKFGPARINAGPVGSMVLNDDAFAELASEVSADFATINNNFTWGFQAGIGLDLFKKLAIDARYEGSLSRFGESFTVASQDFALDARPTAWIISLGWWF